jgi:hypothetical protein
MFRKTQDLANMIDERNHFFENAGDVAYLAKAVQIPKEKEFTSFLL